MKQQYEARIKELETSRDKQISDMEAKHQKEISKREDEIRSLVVRIECLTRKILGKMSEKRQTPDDPSQLNFLKILQEFSKIPGQTPRILENHPKV